MTTVTAGTGVATESVLRSVFSIIGTSGTDVDHIDRDRAAD